MFLSPRRPSSKMDTAISVLQHLAAIAAYEGDPCVKVLFCAADYLQDVLDCSPALALAGDEAEDASEFHELMTRLTTQLPEGGEPLHA